MAKTVLFSFCQLTLYSPLAILWFLHVLHIHRDLRENMDNFSEWHILNACNYESFEDIILKFGSMV